VATNDIPDQPAGPPADAAPAAAAIVPRAGLGVTLRTAREATGKDLETVAKLLRIRQPYLQALEDGRHKDLPGIAYAIGFLRTYAEFLGLDGEEMVRRFRQDAAADLHARSTLVFPSPVSEGRIPAGGILFLGLVIAATAYGAWFWMGAREPKVAEVVPPLPDRLSSVLGSPATLTKADDKPATPEEAARIPDPSPAPGEPQAKLAVKEDVLPPSEEEPDARSASPGPAAKPEEAAKPPEPVKPPEPAKPAKGAKPADAKPADAAKAAKTADVKPADAAKVAKTADAKPAEAAKPAEPVKPPEPAAAPAEAGSGSRVVLTATDQDCWMQVRELDGQLLQSKLLRKGDSYPVPNRPGLTLTVGNAGGLSVSVDGKRVPQLGQAGQVLRGISLDPAKLAPPKEAPAPAPPAGETRP